MKCELKCDVCGIKFATPFVKAVQQINCYECDFALLWDGEDTRQIIEKSLSIHTKGTQYRFYVDILEEKIYIEIEKSKDNPKLDGTIIAVLPVHYESVKLDYELAKVIFDKLDKLSVMK